MVGLTNQGETLANGYVRREPVLDDSRPGQPGTVWRSGFLRLYGTRYAYYAGAMANSIASEELGHPAGQGRVPGLLRRSRQTRRRGWKAAIQRIQAALPPGHMPSI